MSDTGFSSSLSVEPWHRSFQHIRPERERHEHGGVPGSEVGAEAEGSDSLSACPQGHSQLGRAPPPFLPRCELSSSIPSQLYFLRALQYIFFLRMSIFFSRSFCSNHQASDLRERFDANKNVVPVYLLALVCCSLLQRLSSDKGAVSVCFTQVCFNWASAWNNGGYRSPARIGEITWAFGVCDYFFI